MTHEQNQQHHAAVDSLLDQLDVTQLAAIMQERARKRAHIQARLLQPEIDVEISDEHWARIVADWSRPITQDESQAQGMDFLCLTLRDCILAGHRVDTLFAALRIARWVYAHQPGLGPIGEGK